MNDEFGKSTVPTYIITKDQAWAFLGELCKFHKAQIIQAHYTDWDLAIRTMQFREKIRLRSKKLWVGC
jgi:hypothetical protein